MARSIWYPAATRAKDQVCFQQGRTVQIAPVGNTDPEVDQAIGRIAIRRGKRHQQPGCVRVGAASLRNRGCAYALLCFARNRRTVSVRKHGCANHHIRRRTQRGRGIVGSRKRHGCDSLFLSEYANADFRKSMKVGLLATNEHYRL